VAGRRIFVGRSSRTNDAAIGELRRVSAPYGYDVVAVDVRGCLHLKSAVTLAGDGCF
jgi:dimethylargininase